MTSSSLNAYVLAVALVSAWGCHDQGVDSDIDAGASSGGRQDSSSGGATGGAGGGPRGGEMGLDGSVSPDAESMESALNATGMGACFPKCFELMRSPCLFMPGETVVTETELSETRECFSGGIRERSYNATIDNRRFGITDKTLRDGKTVCLSQLIAKDGQQPGIVLKDGNGRLVATSPDQSFRLMTCASDGRTYQVDPTTIACKAYLAVRESLMFSQGKCEWLGPR